MASGYSQNEIDAKARATADLLLQAASEPDMLEPAWEAYAQVREELARRNLAPATDAPSEQSIRRLLFEVIGFAAFIIMAQELPKRLRRKSPLGDEEPDVEWIRYFNTQFLNRLIHHLKSSDFGRLREVTVATIHPTLSFAEGEPLSLERRVAGHLRTGSPMEAAQEFSRLAAMAMDAEHSALLQPITLRLVESVVGTSRILVKGVFARQLTQDSRG